MKGVDTSGERIGRYRLLEKVGEGGMGVVHLAADPDGRQVAIKVLRPGVASDQTALRRLAREVDSMRRVHSPHVAEIVDADVTAEPPYVVTQYVPGRTLEQAVKEHGPIRGQSLQRLATGLARALQNIHAAGIVHRDLKPGNVMLLENGEPVVIDFGIAQGMDATRLTATGLVIGTPGYLAPEVIEGEDAGTAADVHSWASTVAYAATGRAPFGSGTFESIFYKIMEGRPDLSGMPEPMLPVIRAAMSRNPAERPTAQGLAGLTARIDLDRTRFDEPPHAYTRPLTSVAPHPPVANPRDFRGQLPPAQYPPPPTQPPQQYQPPREPRPDQPKPFGLYKVLSLLLLVGGVGLTLMLPSIGVVLVLLVLLLLRTADRVHRRLSDKRDRRGPSAMDTIGAVFRSPFAALRSALSMLLVSPIGLLAAVVVLLIAMAAKKDMTIAHALALSTAAFVIVQGLGPGSEPARRQLARFWGSVVPTRERALIVVGALGLVVFLLVSFSVTQAPDLRPFNFKPLTKNLSHLRHQIRDVLPG